MVYFGGTLPPYLLYAAMLAASLLAGALWGLIPGYFKARFSTNETLFTLSLIHI